MQPFRLGCVVPNLTDGTSFYRAAGPLQALELASGGNLRLETGGMINWVYLRGVDAVFMQRPFTSDHMKIMSMCKMQGKPIWIDYDDDLYTVPLQNPTHKLYSPKKIQNNITSLLAQADFVSVSTPALQLKLQKILERVASAAENAEVPKRHFNPEKIVVIPNAYDAELFGYSARRWNQPLSDASLCAMWRGSHTHDADLSAYTFPLTEAFARGGGNWTLNFVGSPWWGTIKTLEEGGVPAERVIITPPLDPIEYFQFLNHIRPAFVFVPLLDDAFNRAKSNIAWIEASHAGAMTLAPDWEEWRRPGVINYKDTHDFRGLFGQILKGNVFDRVRMVGESREFIMGNLTLSVVNRRREEIIEKLRETDPWRD